MKQVLITSKMRLATFTPKSPLTGIQRFGGWMVGTFKHGCTVSLEMEAGAFAAMTLLAKLYLCCQALRALTGRSR